MSEQFVLNLSCTICKLAFENEDTAYSTSCGHIFHFACLSSWKSKSTSCPLCCDYNPTTHRVYLNFDEEKENAGTVAMLECKQKITDLERDVEEKRILFQKLRSDFDKYRKSSACRDEGHQKLQNLLKDSNKRFEKKQEQAEQLLKENAVLKCDLESRDGEASETLLKTKNKVLEQKLKLVTAELEKEIAKNTELSIQRLKPQSYKDLKRGHIQPKQQKSNGKKKPGQKTCKIIVIENLSLDQVKYPLENIVVTLAQKMNVKLSTEEIQIVHHERNSFIGKTTLWVTFNDDASKQNFLKCKHLLKNNDNLKSVEIAEVNEDIIQPLYHYANIKLRGKVFNYIAIKSNAIVAKKNLHDKEEVIIKSRRHVDDLLNIDSE